MSKKVLVILISCSFICTSFLGMCSSKVFSETNSSDELQQNKYKYSQAMTADLSLAQEEKIIEMLKKEGKLNKNSGYEESHNAYIEYMQSLSSGNKAQPKTDDIQKMLSRDMNNINNIRKNRSLKQDKKEVNVLSVLVEYSDYKHNSIDPMGTSMFYKDYTKEHYQNMLFGKNGYVGPNGEALMSMYQYYNEQSGGSLEINGEVTKWYSLNNTAKYYGEDVDGVIDIGSRNLVQDVLKEVVKDPTIDLSKYDKYDRYDIDKDGNYNESDGVIDYLLIVHAGTGEEAGGGSLGSDAIWSHRSNLGEIYKIPGSEYSAFDYSINPEDGALGVFAHEFAHDLGAPDEYDTQYTSLSGAPIGYWSLMSSGSWVGKVPGTEPSAISPYSKEILKNIHGGNWQKQKVFNYDELTYKGIDVNLGGDNTIVRINLPDIKTEINKPSSGSYSYWSGKGRNESNFKTYMTKGIDLRNISKPILEFKTWYDIEEGYDFAGIQIREKSQNKWKDIVGNITTTNKMPGVINEISNGITGKSNGWIDAKFDLKDYIGKEVEIRFIYSTDVAIYGEGFYVDDINIKDGSKEILNDNVEGKEQFILNGFVKSTGTNIDKNYYLVEWRNINGVDKGLKKIEQAVTYSYDPGMVIWYVNEKYNDNWNGVHPGGGFLSVIDGDQVNSYMEGTSPAHSFLHYLDADIQMHDAAFSKKSSTQFEANYIDEFIHPITNENIRKTTKFCDNRGVANDVFRDYDYYKNSELPTIGTKLPELGVQIKILNQSEDNNNATINIGLN